MDAARSALVAGTRRGAQGAAYAAAHSALLECDIEPMLASRLARQIGSPQGSELPRAVVAGLRRLDPWAAFLAIRGLLRCAPAPGFSCRAPSALSVLLHPTLSATIALAPSLLPRFARPSGGKWRARGKIFWRIGPLALGRPSSMSLVSSPPLGMRLRPAAGIFFSSLRQHGWARTSAQPTQARSQASVAGDAPRSPARQPHDDISRDRSYASALSGTCKTTNTAWRSAENCDSIGDKLGMLHRQWPNLMADTDTPNTRARFI